VTELLSAPFKSEMAPAKLATDVSPTDLSLIKARVFGDSPDSIKSIISRMSNFFVTDVTLVTPTHATAVSTINYPLPPTSLPASGFVFPTEMTLVAWFTYAYLGHRGSLRLTHNSFVNNSISSNTTLTTGLAHWSDNTGGSSAPITITSALLNSGLFQTQSTAYAWTQPNLQVSSRGDSIVPMLSPLDFIPRAFYSTMCDYSVWFFTTNSGSSTGTENTVHTDIAMGAGDDYTLGMFLGFCPYNN